MTFDFDTIFTHRGRSCAVVRASDFGPRGPWFEPRPGAVRCGLEQVTFTPCLVLVKPGSGGRTTDVDRL